MARPGQTSAAPPAPGRVFRRRHRLARQAELFAALARVNQAIIGSADPGSLLADACRILVDLGRFSMAWVGLDDPASHEVRVACHYGDPSGHLDRLQVRSDETPLGRGATGTAIRTGRPQIVNDVLAAPEAQPWQDQVRRHGMAASAAFPLRTGGAVIGALTVYAREKGFFGRPEAAVLAEVARNISSALDNLELDARRHRAEQALGESQHRLLRAESIAAFGNWVLNLQSGTLAASRGAHRIYGLPEGEMALRDVQEMVLPEYRPVLDAALRALVARNQPYDVEFTIRRASDGEERILHSHAEYDPGRHSVFGVLQDITERKRAERENVHLHHQLQQAQKMESLGMLAGGIAHDMNNVLGAILAMASAHLVGAPGDPRTRHAFQTICDAAERGGKLVRSLLDFARRTPGETRPVDLNGLVQEGARLLERTTLAKVRVECRLDPDLRPVRGDAAALAHALMNLLVNAADAMPGGGTLTLRSRNLEPDQVEIAVEDTGCGMPREILDRAPDPFFTTKETGKGTGLGLSLVYATVKAHGGAMALQSEPGRGTRIGLRFPADPGVPGGTAADAPPVAAGPAARSLDVLLVDDDDLVLESTGALLEALGHRVWRAASGEAALDLVDGGLAPQAVILDVNMPGLGGAGTLPLLRTRCPGVPVLVATGRIDPAARDLVQAWPPAVLLSKPFGLQEVREHLGRVTA
jgi:PAS domain S-box-containing protein